MSKYLANLENIDPSSCKVNIKISDKIIPPDVRSNAGSSFIVIVLGRRPSELKRAHPHLSFTWLPKYSKGWPYVFIITLFVYLYWGVGDYFLVQLAKYLPLKIKVCSLAWNLLFVSTERYSWDKYYSFCCFRIFFSMLNVSDLHKIMYLEPFNVFR